MGLMKKLTSALVASSLVFSLVGSAFAAYTPAAGEVAGKRMVDLKMLQGRADGDLALNSEITRAELVTVIVRAFGKEEDAKLLKGSTIFPDIQNHWASGNIAMAVALVEKAGSDPIGMPDGTFAPDAKLTPAQAVAFLMKFVGVKADGTKVWPQNYLSVAVSKNLITAEDAALIAPMLNENATRGLVFYLFDRAFISYTLPTGKTFYTQYVDTKAPELTVDAVVETTIDSKVTVTGSVKDFTELYVGSTKVTPAADGKFSAEFALPEIKAEAYTITVTALDLAGNKSEKTQKVTRIVGDAKTVSAPATLEVEAGKAADVAVKVLDEKNQAIAGVEVTGTSDLGTFENGKFTAGEKAGTGTLTLTAGGLTKEVAVTVKAGALAKLVVSPATIDLGSNGTQQFEVAGTDAFGNEVAVTGPVTWTKSAGVISADGEFAAAGATGTVTVTAKVGEVTGTATVNVFGAPAKVQLAAPSALVGNNKTETTLTATVLDANGNVAKNYNGTVTFASSATAVVGVKTASVTAVNGVATTTITGKAYGTTVLSASAPNLAGTTLTYTTTAQVATSVVVAAPGSLAATSGSQGDITLTLKDQAGETMLAAPTGTAQIKVKLTSLDKGIAFFGTDSDNVEVTMDAPSKTATVKATSKVGAATVNAAITAPTGSTVTANSITVNTLVVGDAYQITVDDITAIKAGESFDVVFRVKDFNGNQLTSFSATNGYTVTVYSGETAVATMADMDVVLGVGKNGTSAITVDPSGFSSSKNDKVGTYKVKVTKTGLVAGETSAVINPAAAASLSLSPTPATLAANGAATSTLKVSISDAYGNKVTDGSYAVTLKKTVNNGSTATFADTVVNTVNGEATVTVTATSLEHATGDQFTATATGLNAANTWVKTAIFGAAYQLDFVDSTGAAATAYTLTAGTEGKVYVAVKDAAGTPRTLTNDNGRVVTLTVKDGTTTVGTFTGTTENGVAAVLVNLTTAKSSYTVEVTGDGLVKDTLTGSATVGLKVNPAAAASVAVSADRTEYAANGSKATITVSLKDSYGNTVTPAAGTKVYLKADTASYGDFTGKVGGAGDWKDYVELSFDGTATKVSTVDTTNSFVTNAAGGTVVVTAKTGVSTITDGTLTLTTKVAGSLAGFSIDTISDAKASTAVANGVQKVVVRLTDGNGTLLTNATDDVKLSETITGKTGAVKVYEDNNADGTYTEVTAAATVYTVAAVKGIATFYVINDKTDSVTYSFTVGTMTAKTAAGKFIPASGTKVAFVAADPLRINGDGVAMTTIKAQVQDGLNNVVTSASGTMNFTVAMGNDYISLLTTSAPVVNGEALIAIQSKLVPTGIVGTDIDVKAEYDLDGDGTIETGEAWTGNDVVVVDAANPAGAFANAIAINAAGFRKDATTFTPALEPGYDSDIASAKFEFRNVTTGTVFADLGTDTNAADGLAATTATGALTEGNTYELKVSLLDKAGRTNTVTKQFIVDTTAPAARVAADIKVVSATSIEITFAESVKGVAAAGTGFSVAGGTATLTGAALKSGNDKVVVLTGTNFVAGTTTVSYDAAAGAVLDLADNEITAFTNIGTTN